VPPDTKPRLIDLLTLGLVVALAVDKSWACVAVSAEHRLDPLSLEGLTLPAPLIGLLVTLALGSLAATGWLLRSRGQSKPDGAPTDAPREPGFAQILAALFLSLVGGELIASLVVPGSGVTPASLVIIPGAPEPVTLDERWRLPGATPSDEAQGEPSEARPALRRSRFGGYLLDPGPRADLRLAGARVERPTKLRSGDLIEDGPRRFTYLERRGPPGPLVQRGLLARMITALLLVFIFRQLFTRPKVLGLTPGAWRAECARGALWYLAALPVLAALVGATSLAGDALGLGKAAHPVEQMLQSLSRAELAAVLFSTIIVTPICEELLFRGGLLSGLWAMLGKRAAVALSALCFASVHLGFHAVVPLFGFALLVGWLRVSAPRGSVVAPITAHVLHNALAFTLYAFSAAGAGP
jgi:membrane protease YdiL (CAAX protease family)